MDFLIKCNHKLVVMFVLASAVLFNPVLTSAEQISQALKITVDTNKAAKDSQKEIDKLDEKTRQMLEAYRAAIKETESLRIYNKQLKELIASQEEEALSLEKQMRDIEQTQRKIVPLMYRMIDALEQFVDLDVPFLPKERAERIQKLCERMRRKEIHDPGFGLFAIYGKKPEEAKKSKRFNYEEKIKQLNEITGIIRSAIKEGKVVSVLCSGDPTIYGPNMWYLEAFEDLDPEVIPGVSCFNAANAVLRKGVTSGIKAHSVILTASFGREEYTGPDSIEKLARNQASMAFFTMFLDLEKVVEKLRTHYPSDTPIAIVCFAGYKEKEKIIHATLDTILEKTKGEKLPFEHLIYVGDFLTN